MGFTHYWNRRSDFSLQQWNRIREDFKKILKHCSENGIKLAEEYDVVSPPVCNATNIKFNGRGEGGHETFFMTKKKPERRSWEQGDESFDFCKTARKPYDMAVCLTLLSCLYHAPEGIRLGSDGDWDNEWSEPRDVFKEIFGVDIECPFGKAA